MDQFYNKLLDIIAAGSFSVFGASAAYVYKKQRDSTEFVLGAFIVNLFLAFFIGTFIGSFIPPSTTNPYRDGLLMLSGFCCFPILSILESYGVKILEKLITKNIETATGLDLTSDSAQEQQKEIVEQFVDEEEEIQEPKPKKSTKGRKKKVKDV